MSFIFRSGLLMGALIWLIISAKSLLSMGVMDNPSVIFEHTSLLMQVVVALIILRMNMGGKRDPY
ncbi:hypothetical protein FLM48_05210 [Shewanella sp. Scap07]|uniref:hypothetical protein n=1 Tax=Shewanella sp. Scap07 TaxID=2589987 RepID=UPI0015B8EB0C|nr:hypothetical protein [Shewanella sp. Scap07]QLE84540.1 hypothetical protein FLM48_05210 [Shewanella sp. Scap07]